MLLALWFDFPPASWVPAPPPTPHISIDGGSSGKPLEYPQIEQWPRGAMFEYFDARQAYLKRISFQPVTDEDLKQRPLETASLSFENKPAKHAQLAIPTRQTVLTNVRIAGAQNALAKLHLKVAKFEQQMEDEAVELLLYS
jgi:hypothetical protein